MIEDALKTEVLELVQAAIAEGLPLRVASVAERIFEAHGDGVDFLVHYYVKKTATALLDVPRVLAGDVELRREICEDVGAKLADGPDAPISTKSVVDRIVAAHNNPDWLSRCALAGMKQVVLDVLAEPRARGELQIAYVVARDA